MPSPRDDLRIYTEATSVNPKSQDNFNAVPGPAAESELYRVLPSPNLECEREQRARAQCSRAAPVTRNITSSCCHNYSHQTSSHVLLILLILYTALCHMNHRLAKTLTLVHDSLRKKASSSMTPRYGMTCHCNDMSMQ